MPATDTVTKLFADILAISHSGSAIPQATQDDLIFQRFSCPAILDQDEEEDGMWYVVNKAMDSLFGIDNCKENLRSGKYGIEVVIEYLKNARAHKFWNTPFNPDELLILKLRRIFECFKSAGGVLAKYPPAKPPPKKSKNPSQVRNPSDDIPIPTEEEILSSMDREDPDATEEAKEQEEDQSEDEQERIPWNLKTMRTALNEIKFGLLSQPANESSSGWLPHIKSLDTLADQIEQAQCPDHPWRKFLKVWGKVTSAKTPAIYVDRLNELKIHLATRPAVLKYITTSILPVKELFVVAWACQHPHLRNLHTSRAEAGHAYLKTFITNSTGDLLSVFKCLTLAVDAQLNSVHESIARDTIRTLVNVPKLFIPLLGCVSSFAIKECIEQYNRLVDLDPTEECSHTVTVGLGIPCAHKIAELLENDNQLSPGDFHPQWHLKYNPEVTKTDDSELDLDHEIKMLVVALSNEKPEALPKVIQKIKQISAGTHTAVPILAPHLKSKTKGRPTTQLKKQRSTSTRRNPSAHELVDAKLKKDQMAKKRALKASGRKTVKQIKKSDEDDDIEGESDENLLDGDYEEEESDNEEDGSQSGSQCDENLVNHIDERTAGKNELGEEAAGELGLDGNLATDGDSANEGGLNHPVKIPKHIQQHIKDVFDPTADGNCGFRCLARSLGYAEDGWRKVRKELTKEATDHKGVYLKLQGGEESMNRIIESLEESSKSPITTSQWLNKMNHGQIIANTAFSEIGMRASLPASCQR
ncbi:hypothetical protein MJO29_000634 [Puccinia striiformis f. sp. tritici]|nr:hypothetical protein MJO29_000634 [Puccinia striiformis f. sp. tritici]